MLVPATVLVAGTRYSLGTWFQGTGLGTLGVLGTVYCFNTRLTAGVPSVFFCSSVVFVFFGKVDGQNGRQTSVFQKCCTWAPSQMDV